MPDFQDHCTVRPDLSTSGYGTTRATKLTILRKNRICHSFLMELIMICNVLFYFSNIYTYFLKACFLNTKVDFYCLHLRKWFWENHEIYAHKKGVCHGPGSSSPFSGCPQTGASFLDQLCEGLSVLINMSTDDEDHGMWRISILHFQ